MGSEWKETTLGQIVDEGGGHIQTGPFGSQLHASDYVNKGVPVIMPANIADNRITLEGIARITEKDANRLGKHRVQFGDIIYSRRGDVTRKALITEGEIGMFCGTGCLLVRPGKSIDPQFLKYHLGTPANQEWIIRHAIGATMPNLNTGILSNIPLRVPSLSEQKKIAEVLGSLDNKITLNRQLNQTLEQMAQALFKSWFVDFDPVIDNALAAGNSIPDDLLDRAERRQLQLAKADHQSLPENIRQLFPSEFELTESLGWVPKGWGVKNLTDLVDTVSKTYPLKNVEKVIFLNTGDIEAGLFLHSNYSDVETLPGQAKKSIKNGDILYSEIRPKNKRYAYVNFDGSNHVVSTKLMVLRAKSGIDSKFIYFVLTRESCLDELQRIAELRSGTFPQITFDELSLIELPIPDNTKILSTFSEMILDDFYEKQFQLQLQNKELSNLRDTLLPKLISGELRIPEAQAQLEEVSEWTGSVTASIAHTAKPKRKGKTHIVNSGEILWKIKPQ